MSYEFPGTTVRIFNKFSGLVKLCKGLINFEVVWRSIKGRFHGNQLKSQNWRFCGPIFIVALHFRNGLEYRNADGQHTSVLNQDTPGTNLVRFDVLGRVKSGDDPCTIWYKFGGLLFCTSGVKSARLCTACIYQHSG